MGSFSYTHVSKYAMMPEWHQLVPMSGHAEESETVKNLQLYVTLIFQVHSIVFNSIIVMHSFITLSAGKLNLNDHTTIPIYNLWFSCTDLTHFAQVI